MGELIKVGSQSLSVLNKHIKIANKALVTVETDRLVQLFIKHSDRMIKKISMFAKFDLGLIEDYEDSWHWGEYGLSSDSDLPWSEALIERYEDCWEWGGYGA